MAIAWVNDDVDFIRRRYDRIGSLHKLFDWLLFQPVTLRRTAVEWIGLRAGGRVMEIGCGTSSASAGCG